MNDAIKLAAEQAAQNFGGGDGVFSAAGFSNAMTRIAGLGASAAIDGHLVRALLSGRDDIEPLTGGHYRLVRNEP